MTKINLNDFDFDFMSKGKFVTKTYFGHVSVEKNELTDGIQKSLEKEVAMDNFMDAFKFPFSLSASGLGTKCFWNIYGVTLLLLGIFERLINSDRSYVLFASPWGFIFDLLGRQATAYGAFPAFLIYVVFIALYIQYASQFLARALVFELSVSGKIKELLDESGKSILLKEPSANDLKRGLLYSSLVSFPSALIVMS